MLSNVTKKCDENLMLLKILTVEKPVAGGLSSVFKCSWKMLFFKNGDTEIFKADRNKLLASNKRLIDNHTLVLHMLHSYMPVVCTHHCRGVFKKIFWCDCCSLLIFGAKKAT